jgi:para-aminobenzoate synthetase component 2
MQPGGPGEPGRVWHADAVTRILVVDNYDSFVFNLVQYLEQLGARCDVRRNDAITIAEIAGAEDGIADSAGTYASGYQGILLSPGPGVPADAGICEDLVRWAAGRVPVLGVCLGHQVIAEVFGAVVDRAEELLHGRTSQLHHTGSGLFDGLPDPLTATRYHSLAVVDGTVPAELEVTARTVGRTDKLGIVGRTDKSSTVGRTDKLGTVGRTDELGTVGRTDELGPTGGVIMGLRHRQHPIEGVQFHPESVLTQGGHRLLANWLRACGDGVAAGRVPTLEAEVERLRLSAV